MQPDPAQALEDLFTRVRTALGDGGPAPAGEQPDGAGSALPAEPFAGSAADGAVRAEVGPDGRLQALRIDPAMLRRPLEDIAADAVTAVNAALDARDAQSARPDTGALIAHLRAVQDESVAQMSRISHAFTEALARAQIR